MVFVKVRETYDLHTKKNKMTVIGIHTPKPTIIKANYPGLLMQCKMYRPVSADVRIACASMLPLDPLGIGTNVGDVAPEDVFNPILYKAMSNKGMSQLEARINTINAGLGTSALPEVDGKTAFADTTSLTNIADEFPVYYGLLSQTNEWKHASAQAGLEMRDLRPLVYEMVYNVGDWGIANSGSGGPVFSGIQTDGDKTTVYQHGIIGNAKPMPFINCTSYTFDSGSKSSSGWANPGFPTFDNGGSSPGNCEQTVPWINVMCGCIIIPPSKLHELYFRMVVEWTIEFSNIRPISEVANFVDLGNVGSATHYQNYSYTSTKEAITGSPDTILNNDACMVSSNVDVDKVM